MVNWAQKNITAPCCFSHSHAISHFTLLFFLATSAILCIMVVNNIACGSTTYWVALSGWATQTLPYLNTKCHGIVSETMYVEHYTWRRWISMLYPWTLHQEWLGASRLSRWRNRKNSINIQYINTFESEFNLIWFTLNLLPQAYPIQLMPHQWKTIDRLKDNDEFILVIEADKKSGQNNTAYVSNQSICLEMVQWKVLDSVDTY